jgi:predicted nucleic acid-binding protein
MSRRSRAVFLDSGIFIAFMSRRDRHHAKAVRLFSEDRPRWSTSLLVVSETYSWFLHRTGEPAARSFRLLIENLTEEGLRILEPTWSHHQEVSKLLDRYRGVKLTYVDASSLSFMSRHRIKQAWATDHHLGLTGAEVLPGS